MKLEITLPLIIAQFVLFFSCSRINQQERQYYAEKHVRHGVVPLSSTVVQKLDQASVMRGKDLYTQHCFSCHGVKGQGDGPESYKMKPIPANLQKLAREVTNFSFFMSISQWQGDMPGWRESFNEKDREDLVSYIKTFR